MGLPQQEWLVKSSGLISGPYSLEELVERLRNRQISVIDEVKGPLGRWGFVREQSLLKEIVAKIREEDLDLYEKTGAVGGDASRTVTVETNLTSENASASMGRSSESGIHRAFSTSATREGGDSDFGTEKWKLVQGSSRPQLRDGMGRRYWSSLFLAFGFVIALVLGISVLMKSQFQSSPSSARLEQSWAAVQDQIRLGQHKDAWEIARLLVASSQLSEEQRRTLTPVALVTGHVREAHQLLETLTSIEASQRALWMSQIKSREKNFLEAQSWAEQLAPDRAEKQFTRAQIFFRQGNWGQALEALMLEKKPSAEHMVLRMRATLQDPQLQKSSLSSLIDESQAWIQTDLRQARNIEFLQLVLGNRLQSLNPVQVKSYLANKWYSSQEFMFPVELDAFETQTEALAEDCLREEWRLEEVLRESLRVHCHWMQGRSKEALQQVESLRLRFPREDLLKLVEAELLVHQQKWTQAKAVLSFVEDLGDSGSLLAGQICWSENDAECVIRQAEQVLERNPDSFLALELRAKGLLKSLRREEARPSVDRLAQLAPLYLSTLQLKREMQ